MNKSTCYFHLFTAPLASRLLFYGDAARKFLLGRMALICLSRNVRIYVYCLMDNHIHVLLSGERAVVMECFEELRRIYSRYLVREGNSPLKGNEFTPSLREVTDMEDFKGVVAYILRNPLVAGVSSAYSYEWSSAFLYFNPWLKYIACKSIKEYGIRNLQTALSTRDSFPENMTVLDGCLNPADWCDYKKVESVFGSSRSLFYALARRDAEGEEEAKIDNIEWSRHSDMDMQLVVKSFCRELGVDDPSGLDYPFLCQLVSTLRRKYNSSKSQIARLTGADQSVIDRYC